MAARPKEQNICDGATLFIEYLEMSLETSIYASIPRLTIPKVKILKRNKDLKCGDFLVILPKLRGLFGADGATSHGDISLDSDADGPNSKCQGKTDVNPVVSKEEIVETLQSLQWSNMEPFVVGSHCVCDNGDLMVKLGHVEAFREVIQAVQQQGQEYGRGRMHLRLREKVEEEAEAGDSRCDAALVNCGVLSDCVTRQDVSLSHLRSFLLSEHVAALLEANGFRVDQVRYNLPETIKGLIEEFGICTEPFIVKDQSHRQCSMDEIQSDFSRLLASSRHFEDTRSISSPSGVAYHEERESRPTVLCLRKFLVESRLPVARDGYDKNLNVADFSPASDRFHSICSLERQRRQLRDQDPCVIVHVVPHEKEIYQQQVDLGWRIARQQQQQQQQQEQQTLPMLEHQVHVAHGQVNARGCQLPAHGAHDYLSLRKSQMKEASVMKYGSTVSGPGWEATINALTVAEIKIELLSTSCRQRVKVEMAGSGSGSRLESKGGVFIMYNAARLATLFHNFETAVGEGVYPPLPVMDAIDFSLLREEEEWALLFNYVLPYADLVRETVAGIQAGTPRPVIHTHKVCHFLQDLCRDLSSYYSRIHVLGEPFAHLLPVMYARLTLLKVTQQVLHNALALLNIQPLSQL